eukprot:TRINITY_DN29271_c0_g1_i1.p1 TRINITY_DN29271_c0_g1~~TRINITY_DN29271_c0_g1_i1.p1  ORF type:complete len:812 (+),score=134.71 TRINITY_DN29271_c0_g1_i1:168-2603(+)
MGSNIDEVLRRTDRLIKSCQPWPPAMERAELWPPESPPGAPLATSTQDVGAAVSSALAAPLPQVPRGDARLALNSWGSEHGLLRGGCVNSNTGQLPSCSVGLKSPSPVEVSSSLWHASCGRGCGQLQQTSDFLPTSKNHPGAQHGGCAPAPSTMEHSMARHAVGCPTNAMFQAGRVAAHCPSHHLGLGATGGRESSHQYTGAWDKRATSKLWDTATSAASLSGGPQVEDFAHLAAAVGEAVGAHPNAAAPTSCSAASVAAVGSTSFAAAAATSATTQASPAAAGSAIGADMSIASQRCDVAPRSGNVASAGQAVADLVGLRSSEAAVLLDGLERENALLRQQLDRCSARERAFRAKNEELHGRLETQGREDSQQRENEMASMAAESQRLQSIVHQQGEMAEVLAARLQALQKEYDVQERRLVSWQQHTASFQAEVDEVVCEIDGLRHVLLPHTQGGDADAQATGSMSPMQATVHRAREAVLQLRLACKAKLETFSQMQLQFNGRVESNSLTPRTPPPPYGSRRARSGSYSGPTGGAHAKALRSVSPVPSQVHTMQNTHQHADSGCGRNCASNITATSVLEQLREELQQARGEAERESTQAAVAARRVVEQDEERLEAGKELETARRALRVREAEVRELQLIGKYFAGRVKPPTPQELDAAELAEELRKRCSRFSEEAEQLRAERDLLRAHAERGGSHDRLGGVGWVSAAAAAAAALPTTQDSHDSFFNGSFSLGGGGRCGAFIGGGASSTESPLGTKTGDGASQETVANATFPGRCGPGLAHRLRSDDGLAKRLLLEQRRTASSTNLMTVS